MYDRDNSFVNRLKAALSRKLLIAIGVGFVLFVSFLVWLIGSANPETEAGYTGYVTRGAVFGQSKFLGTQVGPTSWGRSWMTSVINVSHTPTNFDEPFAKDNEVLSTDGLKLTFGVHVIFTVRSEGTKEFVEKYSTTGDKSGGIIQVAFRNFFREPLRTHARNEVAQYKAQDAMAMIPTMNKNLKEWAIQYTKGTPFKIVDVVYGNMQYPKEVADAVADKLAEAQRLEKMQIQVNVAKKDAERRVAEAEGISRSADMIQQKLTPLFVQHEAIVASRENHKVIADSKNGTVYFIGAGAGNIPLIMPPAPAAAAPSTHKKN